MAMTLTQSVHAVHQASAPTDSAIIALQEQVAALARKVEQLAETMQDRPQYDNHTRGRRSWDASPARIDTASGLCWFHKKFGDKAYKCMAGCCQWGAGNAPTSH
eukprot:scpid50976/ scgid17048/ 